MKTGRVLFIVNGLGLGNSTRCHALIAEIKNRSFSVNILTSSNGMRYFAKFNGADQMFFFEPILYGSSNGKLSILRTIAELPRTAVIFFKNILFLRSLVKQYSFDFIVFDSDYSVIGLLGGGRPFLVAVNNAAAVVEECRLKRPLPKSIRWQYRLEELDRIFHALVPDLVISPQLAWMKSSIGNRVPVPPIVRSELRMKSPGTRVKNVLVMLSGSQFGTDLKFLDHLQGRDDLSIKVVGKTGTSMTNIEFLGKVYENQQIVSDCDLMVVNAGFSAVSEAFVLRKPVVIIPIENHAEQYINSISMVDLGLALMATSENAHHVVDKMIRDFDSFVRAYDQIPPIPNGAVMACQAILERIENDSVSR